MSHDRYTEQVAREKASRDAALGRRSDAATRGDLGPVLKRWVARSILPVAGRLREVCKDRNVAVDRLGSAVFGVPSITGSKDLEAILAWCLKGNSVGRSSEGGTTYAEDLVLAVMATAMARCAGADGPVALTSLVFACGEAARETALGQFITSVQGSKTLLQVRGKKREAWKQEKQLSAVAALLGGQVLSSLDYDSGDIEVGHKHVVTVKSQLKDGTLKDRQITLRVPEAGDWALLEVARHPVGEKDVHEGAWASFAMMVLCAAQAEAGLFDLVRTKAEDLKVGARGGRAKRVSSRHRPRQRSHGLILSDEAHAAIMQDLGKWLKLGFISEPMLTEPENGDYLTVKHRGVAGGRGPKGTKTVAEGTAAWEAAALVMAATPWQVYAPTLDYASALPAQCPEGDDLGGPQGDLGRRLLVEGSYRRLANDTLYLPVYMDFRGRVYTRPHVVTYQGGDLQKSLLIHTEGDQREPVEEELDVLALHLATLYGGPEKLDKAPLPDRKAWLLAARSPEHPHSNASWERHKERLAGEADEPLQLYTALSLLHAGQWDRIPCHLDGTCNGLQHLTALFRDETAAPFVNLTGSHSSVSPADIYAAVAERVLERLGGVEGPWADRLRACVRIDRKLCKKPVMVLPYGGTRGTIEDAVLAAVVEQAPMATINGMQVDPWKECLTFEDGQWVRDEEAVRKNYLAFRDRDLKDHPLLHKDCQLLGGIVWDVICEILPKPIAAMGAFRSIAKSVGSRTLEWSTGFTTGALPPLWVVQAKAKSAVSRLAFKGLHLPGSVRGLAMRVGHDEVDPQSHTTGIVANRIHSLDASHLARTMSLFGEARFGAIHDAFITSPSRMPKLNRVIREAFYEQYSPYTGGPMECPVRLRDIVSGEVEAFDTWYDLADACGATFPELGSWDPAEIMESDWCFS